MTQFDVMKNYNPDVSQEDANYILMNETAYPFDDIRGTVEQISRYFRASKNKVVRCECCGNKIPFHHYNCVEVVK